MQFTAGPPLAPHVTFSLPSFTELRLDWDEPFTWLDHNITEYRIETQESGMTTTTTTNQTTFSHFSLDGRIQQSCKNITFMVSAYSDLGFGEAFVNNIHGLPIRKCTFNLCGLKCIFNRAC